MPLTILAQLFKVDEVFFASFLDFETPFNLIADPERVIHEHVEIRKQEVSLEPKNVNFNSPRPIIRDAA
jgi:hypothetical protein